MNILESCYYSLPDEQQKAIVKDRWAVLSLVLRSPDSEERSRQLAACLYNPFDEKVWVSKTEDVKQAVTALLDSGFISQADLATEFAADDTINAPSHIYIDHLGEHGLRAIATNFQSAAWSLSGIEDLSDDTVKEVLTEQFLTQISLGYLKLGSSHSALRSFTDEQKQQLRDARLLFGGVLGYDVPSQMRSLDEPPHPDVTDPNIPAEQKLGQILGTMTGKPNFDRSTNWQRPLDTLALIFATASAHPERASFIFQIMMPHHLAAFDHDYSRLDEWARHGFDQDVDGHAKSAFLDWIATFAFPLIKKKKWRVTQYLISEDPTRALEVAAEADRLAFWDDEISAFVVEAATACLNGSNSDEAKRLLSSPKLSTRTALRGLKVLHQNGMLGDQEVEPIVASLIPCIRSAWGITDLVSLISPSSDLYTALCDRAIVIIGSLTGNADNRTSEVKATLNAINDPEFEHRAGEALKRNFERNTPSLSYTPACRNANLPSWIQADISAIWLSQQPFKGKILKGKHIMYAHNLVETINVVIDHGTISQVEVAVTATNQILELVDAGKVKLETELKNQLLAIKRQALFGDQQALQLAEEWQQYIESGITEKPSKKDEDIARLWGAARTMRLSPAWRATVSTPPDNLASNPFIAACVLGAKHQLASGPARTH